MSGKKMIHHLGVCCKNPEDYIKTFVDLGGTIIGEGIADTFDAKCTFIDMGNLVIEIISPTKDGTHLDKFMETNKTCLHHLAINDNNIIGVDGALEGMKVSFEFKGKMLLERVKEEKK